ncbi:MAG: hypothetical protein NT117_02050 [Gammaproteobacteria bacterium]|nr:hypothetical protein [Gammaproteobacteria bacterium]
MNGAWKFNQSNGTPAQFELQQSGREIRGTARYVEVGPEGGQDIAWIGTLDGSIDGDRFQFTVYWDIGNSVGIYNGVIKPDGAMAGGTRDRNHPDTYATWSSERSASCRLGFDRLSAGGLSSAPTAGTPRGADGKPAVALGRVKPVAPVNACQRWNVSAWTGISQTNTHMTMWTKLKQEGTNFRGDAMYLHEEGTGNSSSRIDGSIQGGVSGNAINFTANWNNSTTGIYTGSINSAGRAEGTSYQQGNPSERADWSALDLATCDATSLDEANASEKSGLFLGRVRTTGPAPPICDAARSARARNSPAAPGLEARCLKLGETTNMPVSNLVDQAELDRLAAVGSAVARTDYSVGNMRRSSSDPAWRFGFDVGTALFGDPALGGQGVAAVTTESQNIRASLDPASQPGFDESANFHFTRNYGP